MEQQAVAERRAIGGDRAAKIHKIELTDCGQDVTTLHVRDGVIVYCGPFQRLIWEGRALTSKVFVEGDVVTFAEDGRALSYPVVDVQEVTLELTYEAWLKEIDVLAWEQWGEREYTANSGANKPGDPWIEPYLEGDSSSEAWGEEVSAASA
ncbi:hypothetical protein [Paraburkholderia hospita]|uniref:hypothetical protein n=1 Tax=Paraburkholderia hospita TaxID=169430 RepID=UPI0008A745CA|nr:hypothetical protein [Paraburkholderia hospita]SEI14688.1 hypothetical protein SAMN05192544_102589 [Paraburkholderia hospita]